MNIRLYKHEDRDSLNSLAVKAFSQFEKYYSDGNSFISSVSKMSALSQTSDVFIAEEEDWIIGGVAFILPNDHPNTYFERSWAVIRMLVVSPEHRGKGVGRKLTETCIRKAKSLGIKTIGLHTSPIMEVALSMYQRLGFVKCKDIEPIFGVDYSVYKLDL